MTSPPVSLVIATYNWPSALAVVLRSVRAQRTLPDEVVIADDGSRDETRELVAREAATFPVPLVHVWHADTGFRLAAIRNRAIAQARGDYVVQIDGDIVLHPKFVAAHAAFAARGTWVQGSRCLISQATTQRMLRGEPVRLSPVLRGLGHRQNALYLPFLSRLVRGPTDGLRRVRGAHMAFWRDDLLRANGYDEHIEGWGREDSELATRLLNAGVTRRNVKFAAICYHLWHQQANVDSIGRNHEILLRTVRDGRTRCERGIDQYLPPSAQVS